MSEPAKALKGRTPQWTARGAWSHNFYGRSKQEAKTNIMYTSKYFQWHSEHFDLPRPPFKALWKWQKFCNTLSAAVVVLLRSWLVALT